jgi:hypothetical protein
MNTKSITFIILLTLFALQSSAFTQAPLSDALESMSNGNTSEVIKNLSAELFNEANRERLGKIYAVISIAYFLENDKPKEQCENLLFVIEEDMKNSLGASFVKYLSGNATDNFIETTVKRADNNWKAASIIARYVSLLNRNPNTKTLDKLADEYRKLSSELSEDEWGNTWSSRIDKWQNWIHDRSGNKGDLEKLITIDREIKEAAPDIDTITAEELAELKEIYKNRPKTASLDFDEKEVSSYIASLPENLKNLENTRLSTITNIKHYLVKVLERSPYPKGIKTKKRTIRGTITMANKNYLVYKKSTRSKKSSRVFWKDLTFEQYADMMEFYAMRRSRITGAGGKSRAEIKKDAANDFLGAAILCEWFGDYKKALHYAKEAIKYNPKIKESVSDIIIK